MNSIVAQMSAIEAQMSAIVSKMNSIVSQMNSNDLNFLLKKPRKNIKIDHLIRVKSIKNKTFFCDMYRLFIYFLVFYSNFFTLKKPRTKY